jgi:hypothetical protein
MHKKKDYYDRVVEKEILKLNKQGKSIDEIDEHLVYGMEFSPEYSWEMIKKTLKLKQKVK